MGPSEPEHRHLAELVRAKARRNGEKAAARFASGDVSYADLDHRTDRVAAGLSRLGVTKGDRVAALLFNGPEFLDLWFGLAKRGAVLVPLNTALKGEILRYELTDCQPKGLVVDRRLLEVYAPHRDAVRPEFEFVVDPSGDDADVPAPARAWPDLLDPSSPEEIEVRPLDPAAILYTSGTTGPPKGAIIPHQKYLRTSREIGARSRLGADSVLFTALPLFH